MPDPQRPARGQETPRIPWKTHDARAVLREVLTVRCAHHCRLSNYTMLLYCNVAMLPCCHVVMLSFLHVAMLPCCHVTNMAMSTWQYSDVSMGKKRLMRQHCIMLPLSCFYRHVTIAMLPLLCCDCHVAIAMLPLLCCHFHVVISMLPLLSCHCHVAFDIVPLS